MMRYLLQMPITRRFFCCSLFPAVMLAQSAGTPNFTGTWKLNLAKSKLEIAPPDSTVFYIEHKGRDFHLKRTHVFGGKPNTWGIDLIIGGPEVVQKEREADFHARVRSEGDALILDSYWVSGESKATNMVRYTLSKDGTVFTADERVDSPKIKHHNVWVFDRQ